MTYFKMGFASHAVEYVRNGLLHSLEGILLSMYHKLDANIGFLLPLVAMHYQ